MSLPDPTGADVAFFAAHGWIAVPDALPEAELSELQRCARRVHEEPGLALDWSAASTAASEPERYQVLQSMLGLVWSAWRTAAFAAWTEGFASAIIGGEARLWYDQLLDKPPLRGAATWWHQDGACLGPGVGERLVSAWIPLDDVDVDSGCMHVLDRGHRGGVLDHERFAEPDCGRGACPVDPARVVSVPLRAGGVTFHHGLMPHMATANRSPRWRQVLIQRFTVGSPPGSEGGRTAST